MTVYVVHKPRPGGANKVTFDLSPALQFGSIEYIFDTRDQPGLTPGPSLLKALKVLKDFSDDDYLCWAGGDPSAMIIATAAAMQVNRGKVGYLRWERSRDAAGNVIPHAGYYVPNHVNTRTNNG